jgi:hypothetical protein
MAPSSQKYESIGFYLVGGGQPPASFTMYIRPEDISRSEPSRLAAIQTLGGAWVDAFGRGLSTLTLNGHQGWRGNYEGDGGELFTQLRNTIFLNWHSRRSYQVSQAADPNLVQLFYVDQLNNITALVAPQSFTLRRSKTSPLLVRYQAQLIVLDDNDTPLTVLDAITGGITNPLRWVSALTAISQAITTIENFASSVVQVVSSIASEATAFLSCATLLFQTVANIGQYAQGVFDQTVGAVLQAAIGVAIAGRNAFYALSTAAGLVDTTAADFMGVASAFSEVYCSIVNGFNLSQVYTTFDPFFGASNCSSTGGGDPPSYFTVNGTNPFESFYASTTPTVSVSAAAQSAINALALDPLNIAGEVSVIGPQLGAIGAGVTSTTPAAVLAALNATTTAASAAAVNTALVNNQAVASAPSFTKTLTGYRKVETYRGDTLQRVAARELGDASQWPDLANLNGLVPPYITDNPEDVSAGVVISGTNLIVPAPAAAASAVVDTNTVFGTDMALTSAGTGNAWCGVLTADAAGDFSVVSGADNLVQAVENRLVTRKNELLNYLDYGCDVYNLIGAGNGPITAQLAATFVNKAIKADPRILSTQGTTVTITLDQQSIETTAITTDGKQLPVGIAQLPG